MGIIGQQPGDNKIVQKKTLVKQETTDANALNEDELNKSAEEIQFNMGGRCSNG